jgi:hypothetical protein
MTPFRSQIRQRGFLLGFVLWSLALAGLVATALSEAATSSTHEAATLSERFEAERAMHDVWNELLFLLATRPVSRRGLEIGNRLTFVVKDGILKRLNSRFFTDRVLLFDGQPYHHTDRPGILVRLQDEAGLINLETASDAELSAFVGGYGLATQSVSILVDRLRDYLDADDLRRPHGAERGDYAALGFDNPANGPLATPWQALAIPGWKAVERLWRDDADVPLLTSGPGTRFNVNTAPPPVLRRWWQIGRSDIDRIIARRAIMPFRNFVDLSSSVPALAADNARSYSFAPVGAVIVQIEDTATGLRRRFAIDRLPPGSDLPWRIRYVIDLPSARRNADAARSDVLRSPEELPPVPERRR